MMFGFGRKHDDEDPPNPESLRPEHHRDKRHEETLLTEEEKSKRRSRIIANRSKGYWADIAEHGLGMMESFGALLCVPLSIYIGLVFTALYFWHTHFELILIAVGLIGAMCFVWIIGDMKSTQGGKWYMFLGFLGMLNIVAALVVADFVYSENTYYYYRMSTRRTYQNVLPSEPSNSHADAGKIYFAEDARVDVENAVGFKAGSTYCVAPLRDDNEAAPVSFWAVGLDCCSSRASFTCDAIENKFARGGAVIMDAPLTASTMDQRHMFKYAARQAASVYNLVISAEPVFVRWVVDPNGIQDEYWANGFHQTSVSVGVASVFAFFFAGVMHMVSHSLRT